MFHRAVLTVVTLLIIVQFTTAFDCESLQSRSQEIEGCCTAPEPYSKDKVKKCFESTQGDSLNDQFVCMVDCAFRELGLLEDGDNFNKDKALEIVQESLEGEWRETVTEIINTCVANVEELKEQAAKQKSTCPLLPALIQVCVSGKMFHQCPTDKWQSTEFCEDVKKSDCFE